MSWAQKSILLVGAEFLCLVAMLGKLHDWSFTFKNILKLILFFLRPAYFSFQKPRWKFLNCEYFSFEETNLPSLHLPNAHEGDRTCLKVFDYDKGLSFDWSQGWGGNATNLPAAPGPLHFISGGGNCTCRKLLQVRVPLWAEGQRKILQVGKRNSRNLQTFYIKLAREIIRQLKSIFLRNRELSNVWSDFFTTMTLLHRFLPDPQFFNETLSTCSEHGARPAEFQEAADAEVFKEIFRGFHCTAFQVIKQKKTFKNHHHP